MRLALIILLIALPGCSTIRKSLGDYQKAADKGAGATAADAPREDKPAPLPGGLGGDKANAAYTSPPPQD